VKTPEEWEREYLEVVRTMDDGSDIVRDIVRRAQLDAWRAAREQAAAIGESYEPRCGECPRGVAMAIRCMPEPGSE
jgi:hypothetical protein